MTIQCMCFACWIAKAADTLNMLVPVTFPWQQWLYECASLLHYMYIAGLITEDLYCTVVL